MLSPREQLLGRLWGMALQKCAADYTGPYFTPEDDRRFTAYHGWRTTVPPDPKDAKEHQRSVAQFDAAVPAYFHDLTPSMVKDMMWGGLQKQMTPEMQQLFPRGTFTRQNLDRYPQWQNWMTAGRPAAPAGNRAPVANSGQAPSGALPSFSLPVPAVPAVPAVPTVPDVPGMVGKAYDAVKGYAGMASAYAASPEGAQQIKMAPLALAYQNLTNPNATPEARRAAQSTLFSAVKPHLLGMLTSGIQDWWGKNKQWAMPVGVGVGGLLALMWMMNRGQDRTGNVTGSGSSPRDRKVVYV